MTSLWPIPEIRCDCQFTAEMHQLEGPACSHFLNPSKPSQCRHSDTLIIVSKMLKYILTISVTLFHFAFGAESSVNYLSPDSFDCMALTENDRLPEDWNWTAVADRALGGGMLCKDCQLSMTCTVM